MIDNMECSTTLQAEKVSDYLRCNPDFLVKHPELINILDIPHQTGGVVSLVERQVKSLRDENRRLQGQLIEVLRTAQDNEKLFRCCNRLFTRWLQETSRDNFVKNIHNDITELFNIDYAALILNDNNEAIALCEQLDSGFPDKQPLCGPCDPITSKQLFPPQTQFSSMAIVPLGANAKSGILLLASNKSDGFSPTMGTLFLEQIGDILDNLLTHSF